MTYVCLLQRPLGKAMVNDPVMEPELSIRPRRIRRKVLVVDDDVGQLEVLERRLDSQGYDVITARNGMQALELARTKRVDIILLDIRLPDISGLEVCSELMDDPDTCGIPVILVSGMERPDMIRCARSAGCKFFIRKPYDPNALLVLVESALRQTSEW